MSEYGLAVVAIALCTGLCLPLFPLLALTDVAMVYLVGALLIAMRGRRGPAAAAAILSVLSLDFFFVPPRFAFAVEHPKYIVTFLVMLAVAVLIGHLMLRNKAQAEAARLGETRMATLHALSQQLAETRGVDAILVVAIQQFARIFNCEVTFLTPESIGASAPVSPAEGETAGHDGEPAATKRLAEANQLPPIGVQAFSGASFLDVPLVGAKGLVGALRLRPKRNDQPWTAEQVRLLESFAHQVAMSLEVDRLQEDAHQSQISANTERVRSSLLSAVSHDLRTPLATILGSASTLLRSLPDGIEKRRELLQDIKDEAERLSRLVQNLIETTRLTSGPVKIKKEPCSVEELVGSALERLDKTLVDREVNTRLPEDLPLASADAVLMELAFVNLIENAVRHTPSGSAIEISARPEGASIEVEIADRGAGLAPDDLERVFQKFYRSKEGAGGAGLGLAICKAVVEAHGGRIWAENRQGGGASFHLTLPKNESR